MTYVRTSRRLKYNAFAILTHRHAWWSAACPLDQWLDTVGIGRGIKAKVWLSLVDWQCTSGMGTFYIPADDADVIIIGLVDARPPLHVRAAPSNSLRSGLLRHDSCTSSSRYTQVIISIMHFIPCVPHAASTANNKSVRSFGLFQGACPSTCRPRTSHGMLIQLDNGAFTSRRVSIPTTRLENAPPRGQNRYDLDEPLSRPVASPKPGCHTPDFSPVCVVIDAILGCHGVWCSGRALRVEHVAWSLVMPLLWGKIDV